jgi:hypothetical protein
MGRIPESGLSVKFINGIQLGRMGDAQAEISRKGGFRRPLSLVYQLIIVILSAAKNLIRDSSLRSE